MLGVGIGTGDAVDESLNLSGKSWRRVLNWLAEERSDKKRRFCGSFDGNMTGIMRENPDVLLTGEIKYHNALELVETGVKIIQAGHFNTERLMEKTIASLIGAEFPQVDSMASKASTDVFEYR